MSRPLVSVITVVYNARPTLEATIKSVLSQDRRLVEYWIIDGGSTDGSLELIKQYEGQLSGWISEPDKGIYDAMNKGINRANGSWLFFLGADDLLMPSVITRIQCFLDASYKAVFGKVVFENGAVMQSDLSARTMLQNTVHHQSVFYHQSLFKSFRYDAHFRAIADYELNLKIWLDKLPYRRITETIACCYAEGTSSSFELSLRETNQVRSKLIHNSALQSLLSAMLRLYYAQKRIRGVSMVGTLVQDKH